MDTLIKWPGGKTREFSYIKDLIPSFERYIEPFFGGGAVFFQLEPKKAIVNDICEELMDFYRFIKNEYNREEFKKELYEYVENWEKIPKYLGLFKIKLFDLYEKYKLNKIELSELKKIISETLKKIDDFYK